MPNWSQEDVDRHNAKIGVKLPAHLPPAKRQKFGNIKTVEDNMEFDSKKEADHYRTLKMRAKAGQITQLECQPRFEIYIVDAASDRDRVHIGWYTADFRYYEFTKGGEKLHVEDVKSKATKTTSYQLRKKLVEAIYNITITEI